MARKTTTDSSGAGADSRQDRLKAALKANLARRKAQSRGRKAQARKGPAGQEQNKDA